MSANDAQAEGSDSAISAYKALLKAFLDNRPSGTRQKLATALGTHKSFISQITSPSYRIPVPAQHVGDIMRICHFSADERDRFLAAYRKAHPNTLTNQARGRDHPEHPARTVTIEIPDLGDPAKQAECADLIVEMAHRLIILLQRK